MNLEYLPARHTDFIFSVLGEEWGFAGVSVVLTLYLFLIVESLSPTASRAAWNVTSVAVSAVKGSAPWCAHQRPNVSRSERYAVRVFSEGCSLSQPSRADRCSAISARTDRFSAMRPSCDGVLALST